MSIAFISGAKNLISPFDELDWYDIFVADMTGPQPVISRASPGVGGVEGNNYSYNESISQDGRFITFQSEATNLAPVDPNGGVTDVWVFDRQDESLRRAKGTDQGFAPSINRDGSVIAFHRLTALWSRMTETPSRTPSSVWSANRNSRLLIRRRVCRPPRETRR